ncbi:MAG: DUF1566 domain-containing protein [Pseudomonadota bacterium]
MDASRRLVSFCIAAGLAGCGGGGGGGSAPTSPSIPVATATVSGKVLDRSGAPVAGVTISAYYHNVHSTVTTSSAADGSYSIGGLDSTNTSVNQPPDYEIYAEKNGLAFYPAVSDSSATISKFDFNGYYRTVIRFLGPPARTITGNNFTAFRAGDKVASLPRTGQTSSYASGDDGAARQGVALPATRFSDNGNGSVTDQLTGLVWLKNAGCVAPTNWSAALTAANQLASGACGLSDGSRAGQWRMPNANELESLVDVGRVNPAIASGHPFSNINTSSAYWSSTTYMALTANAMAIRLSDGRWINGIDANDGSFNNNKNTSLNAMWAVKSGASGLVQVLATGIFFSGAGGGGGATFGVGDDASLQLGAPLTSPRFIDNGNGTLVDTVTGLLWLKKADCVKANWANALSAVNRLASGQCGLSDGSGAGQWRLPNRNEMLSLSDRAPTFPQAEYFNGQAQQSTGPITGPVIFNSFVTSDYYWTSTTTAGDAGQAWSVWSCDFGVYNLPKTDLRYALAVRN